MWLLPWYSYALGSLTLYILFLVFYRLFLHPLAKIPGPFWPAVTNLPSFYHNFIQSGQWYKKVERYHSVYGNIIRIGPNEIHLNAPEDYDKIYGNASKFYKDPKFYNVYGMRDAMFCTIANDLHRRRRTPLNPFFARRAILECEDIVHDKVAKLCRRIDQAVASGKPIDLSRGFRAVSVDVVTGYAFDNSLDLLDEEDFGSWFADMIRKGAPLFWVFQQFPITQTLAEAMPRWLTKKLSPAMNSWERFMSRSRSQLAIVQAELSSGSKPARRTMFHQMLAPELTDGRVAPSDSDPADEALSITAAAADSTGNAMSYAVFQVLTDPALYDKVKTELRDAFPNPHALLPSATLEKLPYLTGVVKESLRMSYGVIGRLPRVVPDGGTMFHGYHIPAGTTVSMSTWSMHHNANAFPDPDKFDPTRWLAADDNQVRSLRDKCLVPFSRGARMCLGHALATCELYCAIATVLHRFDHLEPYRVGERDMLYEDYVGAVHPRGAAGFHVTATRQPSEGKGK